MQEEVQVSDDFVICEILLRVEKESVENIFQ
jgi:hypothetical protein